MKNFLIISLIFISLFNYSFAQENKDIRIPLIGETAPSFEANSTNGNIKFPDDYFGKWKILFSHPADFTPVCTSEVLELSALQKEFKDLNTAIVVISTDGINSHIEWIKSIEKLEYNEKKIEKIQFPLITDANLEISKKYGMLHPYSSSSKDVRGVFIIDPENKIQAMFFYPTTVGRNLDEIKRTLIALQMHQKNSVMTPANWSPGEEVLIPSPKTIEEAEKLKEKKDPNLREVAWYMWLKKI
jgi:peroxiredoxin (alkyl hydroperoxide reductase subunit C)